MCVVKIVLMLFLLLSVLRAMFAAQYEDTEQNNTFFFREAFSARLFAAVSSRRYFS